MIDTINQRITRGTAYPIDRVSGYTMQQIEEKVMDNATFSGLRDDMRSSYNNPTEGFLNELRYNW